MQLTNTFTEVIINVIPSTLKNSGTTDIEIALSNEVPTQGDYSLAPNQYYNIENNTKKLWARAKVTEGTVTLLNFRHLEPLPPLFLGSQPHPSLVLGVHATPQGLFSYNRFDDKMPFKTKDNAGLQILEETPDYIQYICKNAIFTTVQKYVPGVYQTFMERMIDIESSNDLIKSYNIEWTHEDNSNLFIQLNNEALEKLESQPMMLPIEGEEPTQPIVLEPKTVPTTYDCCFTIRKDDNYSLYINEGYENLFGLDNSFSKEENGCLYEWDYEYITFSTTRPIDSDSRLKIIGLNRGIIGVDRLTVTAEKGDIFPKMLANSAKEATYIENGFITIPISSSFGISLMTNMNGLEFTNEKVKFKNLQITKTSTPKPFVKTIQPNCKLAFETPATSKTHSFIMKGVETNGNSTVNLNPLIFGAYNTSYERIEGFEITNVEFSFYHNSNFSRRTNDLLNYKENRIMDKGRFDGTLFNIGNNRANKRTPNHFRQLLIYKDNLTEAELKAELAKGFKLNPNLYLYPDNILGEIFTRVA